MVPTCPPRWSRSQGQLGELAPGDDAYGGLSRQSSARDVGCNSGGRSCQSCRQVRPCDVSGLHSEEAPHEEKESEPNLKEHTGNREDETDVSEDLQDRPVGEEGVSGEPQIVRRLGISRASNRHGRTPSHRSRCFYRLHLAGVIPGGRGDVQFVGDLTMIPTMLAMLLRFDHYAGPEACDLKTEPIAAVHPQARTLRRMTVLR